MKFTISTMKSLGLAAAGLQIAEALQLDVNNSASIRSASSTIAYGLMKYYVSNATGANPTAVGTLPGPYYWWEAGAMWGGLVDYYAYTNDMSYNPSTTQALLTQGNDDQAFWALAAMSAAEYGYPDPPSSSPQWLSLAEAVFNIMVPRWDMTTCAGGLRWQIFSSNAGYDYKNSISNGGFFQLAARLGRYTGNQTYIDWAEKIWDWSAGVGLIDRDYAVFDGTDLKINCTGVDHTQWSYNVGMYLHGAATLYNYTNGSALWESRTSGLLQASNIFFSPFPNATDVMFEPVCELASTCNYDQFSFKAYLSRWMAKSAILAPYTIASVTRLLRASALAAAASCSGPDNACGAKWYVGGFDGVVGVGQQLSALETIQSLLLLNADGPVAMHEGNVKISTIAPTSSLSIPDRTAAPTPAAMSRSAGLTPRDMALPAAAAAAVSLLVIDGSAATARVMSTSESSVSAASTHITSLSSGNTAAAAPAVTTNRNTGADSTRSEAWAGAVVVVAVFRSEFL
ncbi:hypothetical protein B0A49_07963 [Cryomyces minteri]|uniref:mannan endo-1,6-alpha-mannosidase n=1 Tax=Cryomyces minteri TaxID=331657 RepID=A0A4U0WPG4_9PEZI|nr:hypothetical protein B0A49_07963 [Cryomyces minteri]